MKQLGFSFEVSRCSGCFACVVACMDENDIPGDGFSFRQVARIERGSYPAAALSYFSLACQHCGDAPCVTVCPTGALFKRPEDGIVDLNRAVCVGCHSCAMACPFGAPRFPDGKSMSKCSLCADRIDNNLEPACVRVCPTRALRFGDVDELAKQKSDRASRKILASLTGGEG
jgi:anaerobic dimethyl sulfoxide reductase subunit B (iron-sulfur subunit)